MDKVITEIIIGAIILSLLLFIIPIYRSSAQLVSTAGEQSDMNEIIKEVKFGRLPAEKDFITGSYMKELLRYIKDKYSYKISVTISNKTYVINNESTFNYEILNGDMVFEVKKFEKKNNYIEFEFGNCSQGS